MRFLYVYFVSNRSREKIPREPSQFRRTKINIFYMPFTTLTRATAHARTRKDKTCTI